MSNFMMTVEVCLGDFSDNDLIEELEERGYEIEQEGNLYLTDEERDWVCETIIGLDLDRESITRSILEKLKKK